MAATIKDIAREAGVSVATVSRALTEKDGMSEETRECILQIAKNLNYYPNLQARGLVAKKLDVLGIIIPRTSEFAFSNPFYAEILKGIGKKAREDGQYLLFSFAGEDSYARMYQHGLAAGIIVVANRIDDPLIEEAWKMKIPLVLIPGYPQTRGIPSVDGDSFDGAFKAVEYLAGLGHRRIALLNGPMNSKYSIERLAGYRKGLKKHHLLFDKGLILEFDASMEGGHQKMRKLLSLRQVPTAVLVINDYSALGALRAAQEMSFKVPEDISIIGFGDVPFASMTDPPLTTIKTPYQQIGYESAAMLLKVTQGKRLAQKHRVLPVELIIRKSTAPPSGRKVAVS
ncbi:MAG: LacI family transcriptional regulator [Proteobacteria bacterium]|nr:LacI family transcriptional regulator [Pseudomonadota bacterium]